MKNKLDSISVVIPAYNEEKRIIKTLEKALSYLRNNFCNFEILVVDDGSQDGTIRVVNEFAKRNKCTKNVCVVSQGCNKGKGEAVKTGLIKAKYPWVLMMDADECTPIEDVQRLLKETDGKDVVYGSRYLDRSLLSVRQPLMRRFIGRAGNVLARAVIGITLVDTQCGFKLFENNAGKKISNKTKTSRWGWDLEALVVARENRLVVAEVPVRWRHVEGSRFRAYGGVKQTFIELFRIRKNLQKGIYK